MAAITDIAEAIKNALHAHAFSMDFVARRSYRPRVDLEELTEILVTVVPAGITPNPAESTRGGTRHDCTVDIGIQRRYEDDSNAGLDPLVELAEEIMDYLRSLDLGDAHGARLAAVENDPVFAPEHMDQRVFTSVIKATYAVWR